jgi:hypothetical protein
MHGGPAPQGAPGRIQVQADPQVGVAGADRVVHQVQLLGRVGHERDAAPGPGVGGQRGQGGAVGGRVAHDQVVAGALGAQPERLAQRVAEQARVAGPGQDPVQQGPATDRLAGHPDRAAGRPADQISRVVVERGQVDHGQRRVQSLGGLVEDVLGDGGGLGGRTRGHFRTVGHGWPKVKT